MCVHMQHGTGFVVTDYGLSSTVVLQERTCWLRQRSVLPLASMEKLGCSWTSNRQTLWLEGFPNPNFFGNLQAWKCSNPLLFLNPAGNLVDCFKTGGVIGYINPRMVGSNSIKIHLTQVAIWIRTTICDPGSKSSTSGSEVHTEGCVWR